MVINSDFDITVLKIVSTNRLMNYPSEAPIRRQRRRLWAIALKHSGKTIYTANGSQILSDGTHPVILPKGCSYSWRCIEPGECLIVEFDALQEQPGIFSFTVSDNSFIANDFLKLEKLLQSPTPEGRLEALQILYGLLLQLVKTTPKEYVPRKKQLLLQPAISYLTEHYTVPSITNDTLAKLCGISTVYFRKCFETLCGVSPIRYLHDLRIRKAKDLLTSDYGSIGQVAQSVGYSSLYHFSKMFKSYTGLSPTQYAKAARK